MDQWARKTRRYLSALSFGGGITSRWNTFLVQGIITLTFDEKVEVFISDMKSRGEVLSNINPTVCRLLWRVGFRFPPPIFLPFKTIIICSAGLFSIGLIVLWYLVIFIFSVFYPLIFQVVLNNFELFVQLTIIAIVGGILFGLVFSLSLTRKRKLLNLSSWDNYPNADISQPYVPKTL